MSKHALFILTGCLEMFVESTSC